MMDVKSELKLVRLSLIVSIIAGISFLGVLFLDTPNDTKNDILGTETAFSGFGEISLFNPQNAGLFANNFYEDTNLGFVIFKPNSNWEIHSAVDEFESEELESLKTIGFVDGIFIEQNHNKQFLLTIFDIQKEDFSLHEYIDDQISLMESQNYDIPFEQVSPDNDWAIFAVNDSVSQTYGEQFLILKENRLYMLQYTGDHPETLSIKQKENINFIMDSFEVI
ncbi:hypothetical protein [Nitrosopumilus sp.]|uniref:hypothetical protein n=1 Tax=Nitrosopumilus sp. TaxID=2024843 RepID=UPI003D0DC1A6